MVIDMGILAMEIRKEVGNQIYWFKQIYLNPKNTLKFIYFFSIAINIYKRRADKLYKALWFIFSKTKYLEFKIQAAEMW